MPVLRSPSLGLILFPQGARKYATTPPPPSGQPAPKQPGSDNSLLYTALGITAIAGGYYWFSNANDADTLGHKAKADEEEMKRRARESIEAGKARVDDAQQQGQQKYDEAKVCTIYPPQ